MSTYTVVSVVDSPAGVSVTVRVEDGTSPGGNEEYLISRDLLPWKMLSPDTPLPRGDYKRIVSRAEFSRAVARTKEILSYAAQSCSGLKKKLLEHGFSEQIAEESVRYAVDGGLLCEETQATHAAETYLRRKYWGEKRIRAELGARGYTPEVIEEAISAIDPSEFVRTLVLILRKKYGTPPTDAAEMQKMVFSLLRLGYTGTQIKEALATLARA